MIGYLYYPRTNNFEDLMEDRMLPDDDIVFHNPTFLKIISFIPFIGEFSSSTRSDILYNRYKDPVLQRNRIQILSEIHFCEFANYCRTYALIPLLSVSLISNLPALTVACGATLLCKKIEYWCNLENLDFIKSNKSFRSTAVIIAVALSVLMIPNVSILVTSPCMGNLVKVLVQLTFQQILLQYYKMYQITSHINYWKDLFFDYTMASLDVEIGQLGARAHAAVSLFYFGDRYGLARRKDIPSWDLLVHEADIFLRHRPRINRHSFMNALLVEARARNLPGTHDVEPFLEPQHRPRLAYNEAMDVHADNRDERTRNALRLLWQTRLNADQINRQFEDFIRYFDGLAHSEKKARANLALRVPKENRESFGPLLDNIPFSIRGFMLEGKELIARLWNFISSLDLQEQPLAKEGILTALSDSFTPLGDRVCNQGKTQRLCISVLQGRLRGVQIDDIEIPNHDLNTHLNFFFANEERRGMEPHQLREQARLFCDQNPLVARGEFLAQVEEFIRLRE